MTPRKVGKKEKKYRTVKRLAARRNVSGDKHLPPYVGEFGDIQRQIYLEYNLGWNYMRPKTQKWLARLRLYNNQRRDEDKVGEPLIYDTHSTVMSILCGDKLGVEFGGRDDDESEQAENLNIVAENDYDEMRKEELDYEWNWDALFFGSGLVLMNDFDTDSNTPIPTVIDPTTFIRNPGAVWVNGNRAGEGALLFGGYEVKLTESMMRSNPRTETNPNGYFNLDQLQRVNDLFSLSGEAKRLRREAQGMNDIYTFENSVVDNYEFSILRWFTHVTDPITGIASKYIVEMANNRMLPIRVIKLEDRNGNPKKYWPLIQRKFSPISHDWDGTSIPDLTEDKQRFKATILNDLGDLVKSEVKPMYLFDETKFRKTQDFSIKWGKWIPVKGGNVNEAAQALQTKQVSPTVQYVLNYLESTAQKATGTPDVQQGQSAPGNQTGQEVQMQVAGTSDRHSLTAKIFGWSEKEFWRQWYFVYDDNFVDELGIKSARATGLFNQTTFRPLKRDDLITGNTLGPTIVIESKTVSQAKKLREYQMIQGWAQMAVADPGVTLDKTFLYRHMGRLVLPKQQMERIVPLNMDERVAQDENKKLNDEEMPKVLVAQDHNVHLRIHAEADPNPTTKRHMQIHEHFLMMKRQFPGAFPQLPGEVGPNSPNGAAQGSPALPANPQLMNSAQKIKAPQPSAKPQ